MALAGQRGPEKEKRDVPDAIIPVRARLITFDEAKVNLETGHAGPAYSRSAMSAMVPRRREVRLRLTSMRTCARRRAASICW